MNKALIAFLAVIIVIGAALLLTSNTGKKTQTTPGETPPPIRQTTVPPEAKRPPPNEVGLVTINLSATGFSPAKTTVKKMTRVIWINRSGASATVNSDEHPTHAVYPKLNLGEFGDNSSVQLVFDKAGTYGYHNELKPEQKGEIVVTD